ncbi:hypothetical protein [Ammoniphilus sp. 3BR4]|uniref:hypothetical protein n=1 Tax=Ammoniphilus sp. 3BR4 TaxID=3158265 RepID=UPI00346540EC
MKGIKSTPDKDTLKGFLIAGKTVDWISEKWNVTPQTVRAWFSKFNLHLPKKQTMKTGYNRKKNVEQRSCPVCQESQLVNYILAEKHWYCLQCDTEFDRNDVIYVYDDKGELVEVIAAKPDIWEGLSITKTKKNLIRTITV